MVRLDIQGKLERLDESRYWLGQQLGTSWQNVDKMMQNQTSSIRYETIEALCQIFECTPNELFIFDEVPYEGFPLKTGLPETLQNKKRTKKKKTPKEDEVL